MEPFSLYFCSMNNTIPSIGSKSFPKGCSLRKGFSAGISLVEALIVVAITGVLVSIAVPAMTATLDSVRLNSASDMFLSGMYLARSEAITRTDSVVLCKSADGASCTITGGWGAGLDHIPRYESRWPARRHRTARRAAIGFAGRPQVNWQLDGSEIRVVHPDRRGQVNRGRVPGWDTHFVQAVAGRGRSPPNRSKRRRSPSGPQDSGCQLRLKP
jgi:type II secretory pathway pseudopilin PulG